MENQNDIQAPERRPEQLSPFEIAANLDAYNDWRRGGDGPHPEPTELGKLIAAASDALRNLQREVTHWKANHANEVKRARILKERTDMPMERVQAYEAWMHDLDLLDSLKREVEQLRGKLIDGAEVEGLSFSGYPDFPVDGSLCRAANDHLKGL